MLTTKQKKSEKITHKQPLVVTTYKDKIWFLYKIFHEGKSDLYLIASKEAQKIYQIDEKIFLPHECSPYIFAHVNLLYFS